MSGGMYGVDGLYRFNGYQYITTGLTSEQSAALDKNTVAVRLRANSEDMYVAIGADPTAAGPSAEKERADSFLLRAGDSVTISVPYGSDSSPAKVAAIQVTAAGTLDIIELALS